MRNNTSQQSVAKDIAQTAMNHSSDVTLSFGPIHVLFKCDGEFVTFQVYRDDEELGSLERRLVFHNAILRNANAV